MGFPRCFRYLNGKTWVKVISDHVFEEIQIIGNRYQHSIIHAEQFPEKMRIREILEGNESYLEEVECSQFDSTLEKLRKQGSAIGGA